MNKNISLSSLCDTIKFNRNSSPDFKWRAKYKQWEKYENWGNQNWVGSSAPIPSSETNSSFLTLSRSLAFTQLISYDKPVATHYAYHDLLPFKQFFFNRL